MGRLVPNSLQSAFPTRFLDSHTICNAHLGVDRGIDNRLTLLDHIGSQEDTVDPRQGGQKGSSII
jgi:hypothetical protein